MANTPKRVEVTRNQHGNLTLRSNTRPNEFNSRYIDCTDDEAADLVRDLWRFLPLVERAALLGVLQGNVLVELAKSAQPPSAAISVRVG